jgi:hypothetical protein
MEQVDIWKVRNGLVMQFEPNAFGVKFKLHRYRK